ncbi:MAG TPA: hypothetical protein VEY12_06700 [Thermoplasmata archaeon]|nr:hypothetical protein [Thermoplasmata archaeon]
MNTKPTSFESELNARLRRARRLVLKISATEAGLLRPEEKTRLEEMVRTDLKGLVYPVTPGEAEALQSLRSTTFDKGIVWWIGRLEDIARGLPRRLKPRVRLLRDFMDSAFSLEDDLRDFRKSLSPELAGPFEEVSRALTVLCIESEILLSVSGVLRRHRGEMCDGCDEPEDDIGPDKLPAILLRADEALRLNRSSLFLGARGQPPPGGVVERFLREVPQEDADHLLEGV